MIKVLYFGQLSELTQKNMDRTEGFASLKELMEYLYKLYPDLKGKQFQVAINQQIVKESHPLKEGDEIALMPPFAGG